VIVGERNVPLRRERRTGANQPQHHAEAAYPSLSHDGLLHDPEGKNRSSRRAPSFSLSTQVHLPSGDNPATHRPTRHVEYSAPGRAIFPARAGHNQDRPESTV
jgi:hypothetical protein